MSDEKTSHVQQTQAAWKKMLDEQVARLEAAHAEASRVQAQSLERSREAIDELAKMSKETLGYWERVATEWSRMSLEATKNAAEMMGTRG